MTSSPATHTEQIGSVVHALLLLRPFFDAALYAYEYPDISGDPEQLLMHFCEQGWKEGRNPNAGFDTVYYLEQNPDVDKVGWNPYYHFIFAGYKENRRTLPAVMPRQTVMRLLGCDPGDAIKLVSGSFVASHYVSQFNPPLDRSISPVAHFTFRGWLDQKTPNPNFSIQTALEAHPELRQERLNPLLFDLVQKMSAAEKARGK